MNAFVLFFVCVEFSNDILNVDLLIFLFLLFIIIFSLAVCSFVCGF